MDDSSSQVERQKLYDEVWATPMQKLAKHYGLSDRGLAKICLRLNIPVPPRGYWARKAAGQKVVRSELPPLKEGQKDRLYLHQLDLTPVDPAEGAFKEFEKRPENLIRVEPVVAEMHPLAATVQDGLNKAKKDRWGILVSDGEWGSVVRVSEGTKERALRILNALFGAFDARSYAAVYDKQKKNAFIEVKGGRVAFLLEELLDRKQKELTAAEQKDKIKNPWRYSYPEYIKVPSGRLRLSVDGRYGNDRSSWSDGQRQKVEGCLNAFMAAVAKAADTDAKARVAREFEEKKRQAKQRLEEQLEKLRQAEQRKLWALLMESACWEQSQRIRGYVEALKEAAAKQTSSAFEDEDLNGWATWALRQADAMDPLASGAYCTHEDRWSKPSSYGEKEKEPPAGMELPWERMLRRSKFFEARNEWRRDRWVMTP
jgi:hypothetical protein